MDKIKKVFSPGKDADDHVMYGTPSKEGASATTESTQAPPTSTLEPKADAEQKDKGVFRQIFNPGGDKYSEQSYGTTATAAPTMSDQLQKEPASSEPLKGTETAQYNNDRVQQEPIDSTSTTSGGQTTAGPSTFSREDRNDDVSNATYTARSYALGAGSSGDAQPTSASTEQATQATSALGGGDEASREHSGRRLDNSLTGAGTGGAGAGYVGKDELDEFMRHGRDPEADKATYTSRDHYLGSSSDADPFQRPGHELSGTEGRPGNVQSASEQNPGHIPGEFPREDGGDPHSKSSGIGAGTAAGVGVAGVGAAGAGAAASRAMGDSNTKGSSVPGGSVNPVDQSNAPIQTTTNTMRSGSFSRPSQETAPEPAKTTEKENSGGFKGALAAATAAMGLGGAGAYAASRDDKDDSSKAAEAAKSSSTRDASDVAPGSVVSDKTQSYTQHRPGQTSSQYDSSATAPSQTQPQSEDHTARNAALGAGGLGAAGAGAYALSQNDNSSSGNAGSGNAQSVISPETQKYHRSHPSDKDPNLSASAAPSQSQPATSSQPTSQTQRPEEDHTARNTALGAGAAGAAGAAGYGAYEYANRDKGDSSMAGSVVSPETQKYTKSHPSDTDSNLRSGGASAPTSQAQPSTQTQRQPEEDHTARNAALGAGAVGAGGAGAYALSKDQDGNAQSVISPETQKYHRSHPGDNDPNLSSAGASRQTQPSSTQPSNTQPSSTVLPSDQPLTQRPKEEDHTARNAALGAGAAGAAGAAGYGAYQYANRDDPSTAQSATGYPSDTQKTAQTDSMPSSQQPQAYGGGYPSDTQKTAQTDSMPTASQRAAEYRELHPEDHVARDAALGAGGAGAAGAAGYGAYEYGKNDEPYQRPTQVQPPTQKESTPERDPRVAPAADGRNKLHKKGVEQEQPEEDHTGRNAALGAGAVGAAGAAGYGAKEYYDDRKSQDSHPSAAGESQSSEKKHGFMHKILHPREHKREKEEEERRRSEESRGSPAAATAAGAGGAAAAPAVAGGPIGQQSAQEGMVTEPHTGLPMNVRKYGSVGAGGTDGGQQIEGYHGEGAERAQQMANAPQHTVTEPHTGLPMNVEKYGSVGAGGTDGAPMIEGYHGAGRGTGESGGGVGGGASRPGVEDGFKGY